MALDATDNYWHWCNEKGSSAVKRIRGRDIIVVGTSAGGLEALDQLVGQLPTDLPASLFFVQRPAATEDAIRLLDGRQSGLEPAHSGDILDTRAGAQ